MVRHFYLFIVVQRNVLNCKQSFKKTRVIWDLSSVSILSTASLCYLEKKKPYFSWGVSEKHTPRGETFTRDLRAAAGYVPIWLSVCALWSSRLLKFKQDALSHSKPHSSTNKVSFPPFQQHPRPFKMMRHEEKRKKNWSSWQAENLQGGRLHPAGRLGTLIRKRVITVIGAFTKASPSPDSQPPDTFWTRLFALWWPAFRWD